MFVQMPMGNVHTHLWLKETNDDNITGYPHGCSNIFLLLSHADARNDDPYQKRTDGDHPRER